MTGNARLIAPGGPSPVSIHYYCYVRRQAVRVYLVQKELITRSMFYCALELIEDVLSHLSQNDPINMQPKNSEKWMYDISSRPASKSTRPRVQSGRRGCDHGPLMPLERYQALDSRGPRRSEYRQSS